MVFPWLVIGASAALESARRNTPKTPPERQVRQLKDVEHSLRERQKELAGNLAVRPSAGIYQMAAGYLGIVQRASTTQRNYCGAGIGGSEWSSCRA